MKPGWERLYGLAPNGWRTRVPLPRSAPGFGRLIAAAVPNGVS
jgi:hypothetical protein